MSPRIAIACRQVSGVTGTTTTILEHVRRLSALGWEVHLYGEKLDAQRIDSAGGRAHVLRALPWGSYLKRRLFAWLFERAVAKERFDLLWGHGDTLRQDVLSLHNCVYAACESRGEKVPPSSGAARLHARMLAERRFSRLIANSQLMREDVVRRYGIPRADAEVIYPGYDPKRFSPSDRERLGPPMRRELGVSAGQVLIGLITSGDFVKRGVSLFLRSLGRLSPESKGKVRVLIVGQETRLGRYEAEASQSLPGKVRFSPPSAQVERFYHALDILVHPASFEEFGQSVQEALACGVAVVTSRKVGASELIKGEARDMLLDLPDEAALASSIERLVQDGGLRRRLGLESAQAVSGNTWDDNFSRTLAGLQALLKDKCCA